MINDICLTAYDILLRNVMNDIFAVGKYVGRALPLNYIERSGTRHFFTIHYYFLLQHSASLNIDLWV